MLMMYVCSIIFEVIQGEMDYVRDLENIEVVRCYECSPIAVR